MNEVTKARELLRRAHVAAMADRQPGRYLATHDDRDDDMDWYVYRPLGNGTRCLVAEGLYEDDAKFIAACYSFVGKLLEARG